MTTQTLSRRGVMSMAWWIENKSLVALLVLIGVVSFLSPNFFTADNLLNILRQTSVNAIMAVGMTLVILTAGIDLSVGSVLALCGALAATMVAMELVKEGDAARPDPDLTKRLVAEAGKRGLVLLACGVRGNVIRFLAPLTAPAAIVDEGLDLLEQALSASLA